MTGLFDMLASGALEFETREDRRHFSYTLFSPNLFTSLQALHSQICHFIVFLRPMREPCHPN